MKTYVCVNRRDQSFEGLENVEFIFDYIDAWSSNNMALYAEKIRRVLDKSGADDLIVFNGPTFVCGLVGFYWFDNPIRKHFNVARWDQHLGRYVIVSSELGEAFE